MSHSLPLVTPCIVALEKIACHYVAALLSVGSTQHVNSTLSTRGLTIILCDLHLTAKMGGAAKDVTCKGGGRMRRRASARQDKRKRVSRLFFGEGNGEAAGWGGGGGGGETERGDDCISGNRGGGGGGQRGDNGGKRDGELRMGRRRGLVVGQWREPPALSRGLQ